jgi:hypothetical protein
MKISRTSCERKYQHPYQFLGRDNKHHNNACLAPCKYLRKWVNTNVLLEAIQVVPLHPPLPIQRRQKTTSKRIFHQELLVENLGYEKVHA